MALSDLTPQIIAAETIQAKTTASVILLLAAFVDQHSATLWGQYKDSWTGMTNAQKNAAITTIAKDAGVATVTATVLTFIRQVIDLLIGTQYKADLLAKLKVQETNTEAALEDIRAKIAELTG